MFWAGAIAGFLVGGFFGVILIGLLTIAKEQGEALRDYSSPARYDLKEFT